MAKQPQTAITPTRAEDYPEWYQQVVKAADLARGEYFMWAAVDDVWEPEFVARLVAELDTNPSAGLAMSAIRSFRENGKTKEILRFVGADHPAYMTPLHLALQFGSS